MKKRIAAALCAALVLLTGCAAERGGRGEYLIYCRADLDAAGGGEIISRETSSEGLWNEYSYEIVNGDTWYDIEVSGFGHITELKSSTSQYPRS